MTDPYRYLALAMAEKNISLLADIFGGTADLTKSLDSIHNSGGAKILTQTCNLALVNDVQLSWDFQLNSTDISVLAKIYLNSIDASWDEKYWKTLQKDHPDSCSKLISLGFYLGQSSNKGKGLGFHIFGLVSDEMVVFDDAFMLLFINPLWASIALLP